MRLILRQILSLLQIISLSPGPAEREGLGGGLQRPHFFENYKELLRKTPHFQSSSAVPEVLSKA